MKPSQKRILWAVAFIAICVFFAVRYFSRPARPEPVYHGKTLTRWLKQLDDGQAFGISSGALPSPTSAQLEAADAIRTMGVSALPLLMEDIHARPAENSARNQFYRWSTSHLPHALGLPAMFLDVTREARTMAGKPNA